MSDFRLGDLIQAIDENKETMNVQLTGSNVEYVMANNVEIRDNEPHFFSVPSNIIRQCSDFEIFIRDNHVNNSLSSDFLLPLRIAILTSESPAGNIGLTGHGNGTFYNWALKTTDLVGNRVLTTTRKPSVIRTGGSSQPQEQPLFENLIPNAYIGTEWRGVSSYPPPIPDISVNDLSRIGKQSFKAYTHIIGVMFYDGVQTQGENVLIDFIETNDSERQGVAPTSGNLSIVFRGWR